jgi:FkbM family methyltransferase
MINLSGIAFSSVLGKLARFPLQFVPNDVAVPVIQGRLRGKRWLTGSLTHGCWLGSYESGKQKVFEALITPGSAVFDIGANVGYYTLLASVLAGESGHVYAFEPVPRNLRYLRRHIALNQLSNVTVMDSAVSDVTGRSRFSVSGSSAIGSLSEQGEIEVATLALDDLDAAQGVRAKSHLKIDVEGAELKVLRGAEAFLKTWRPSILLATHGPDVHMACCRFLLGIGYDIGSVDGQPVEHTNELLAMPQQIKADASSAEA